MFGVTAVTNIKAGTPLCLYCGLVEEVLENQRSQYAYALSPSQGLDLFGKHWKVRLLHALSFPRSPKSAFV